MLLKAEVDNMDRSECCGAEKYGDYDICLECGEHSDFWNEEEEENDQCN